MTKGNIDANGLFVILSYKFLSLKDGTASVAHTLH